MHSSLETLLLFSIAYVKYSDYNEVMPSLFDSSLETIYLEDKKFLEQSQLPIVTVFGTYTEDLKARHKKRNNNTDGDIVLSRAHFSMAEAVLAALWKDIETPEPKKAWLADPTNFVDSAGYRTVDFTEEVGKTIARHPLLKILKDFVDKFGRKKLPILSSITPPLLYLTQNVHKPVLSFHIAAGNILADGGKTVVQVITDPHVREDYLVHASSPNMYYCVFDKKTRTELLEKASIHDKDIDPNRIFVTGPPVDPRIIACKKKKHPWRSGPLQLCITTGGLGTNKHEILGLLEELLPIMKKKTKQLRLLIYCGTHQDIFREVTELVKKFGMRVSPLSDKTAAIRVLYHPQIMDANNQLIEYGFCWAHGFVTKPSGDMAYDAACSGSFLLTLKEWGEWEHNIREIFEQKGIARRAQTDDFYPQLEALMAAEGRSQSWIEIAMHASDKLDPLFTSGIKNIVAAYKKVAKLE